MEQRPVILWALRKPQTRVEHNRVLAHARLYRGRDEFVEDLVHIAHDIPAVVRGARRGAKLLSPPVHEAHRPARIRHRGEHLRIREAARDVVDHIHARCSRRGRRRRTHGVHRRANTLRMQRLDHRHDALDLVALLHAHRARTRGLTAHVDHVRARRDELARVRNRRLVV